MTSPTLQWRLDRCLEGSLSLMLDRDGFSELAMHGSTFERVRPLRTDEYAQMRAGMPLSEAEASVYHVLAERLGYGAFAAALVALIPPTKLKVAGFRSLSNADIRNGRTLGILDEQQFGPPFIGLRYGDYEHDGLILTWSGRWEAFRGYVRTAKVRFSDELFRKALISHVQAVRSILPEVATRQASCAN